MTENILVVNSEKQQSNSSLQNWRDLNVHTYIRIAIVGILFLCLFYHEIRMLVSDWMQDSSWSHGFLIPLFSLYLINQRKNEILNLRSKPNYVGLVLLFFFLVFYPFNIIQLQYGYFRPLCIVGTLAAIVLFWGGWQMAKYLWLPIFFLIFAIPLPDRYYKALTIPMRQWAAAVAGMVLNLVNGLEADVNGVIINVVYKGKVLDPPIDVAEACSGMRLLMAFLALGVAMAYLHHRPVWQRLVLLASTIPIAILCNIVRVTITGFIYVLGNPKYAQGFYHDMLGIVMLPLAFFFYWALAYFMSNLFVEEKVIKEDVIVRRNQAS